MTLPTTMTTQELCAATGYSAPALVDLEKSGVIAREAKDTWPFETVRKIISHLRERKPQLSEEQKAYHAARADRERLKYAQEVGKLGSTEEMIDALSMFTGWYVATLELSQARSAKRAETASCGPSLCNGSPPSATPWQRSRMQRRRGSRKGLR